MNQREEAIRTQAYLLWEEAGRPEGLSLEFWAAAEHLYDQTNLLQEGWNIWADRGYRYTTLFTTPNVYITSWSTCSRKRVNWSKYGF